MAIHPGPRTKRLIAIAVALVAIALVARFFYNRSTHVYMDDARVDGNVITISSLTAGQVTELPVTQGDAVRAGQLLVRIDARDDIAVTGATPNLVTTPNGARQSGSSLSCTAEGTPQEDQRHVVFAARCTVPTLALNGTWHLQIHLADGPADPPRPWRLA